MVGGIGVIDDTHLLMGRASSTNLSNINLTCSLVLVDITNNTVTTGDIVPLAQLPVANPTTTNPNNNLIMRGGVQVFPNNKILLGCAPGNTVGGNINVYWVQYTYNPAGPSVTFDYQFTDGLLMRAAIGAFPWNGNVVLWNRVASSMTNSPIGMKYVTWNGVATFPPFNPFNWVPNIELLASNDGNARYALNHSSAYPTVLAISTCNFVNLP
jgi:hypothetical protein